MTLPHNPTQFARYEASVIAALVRIGFLPFLGALCHDEHATDDEPVEICSTLARHGRRTLIDQGGGRYTLLRGTTELLH